MCGAPPAKPQRHGAIRNGLVPMAGPSIEVFPGTRLQANLKVMGIHSLEFG